MYKNIVKPVLDRLLALIFVLLFWWLYIILAIMVREKLGSPVLFVQERPGKIDPKTGKERIFKLYKFRTMTSETDAEGRLLPDAQRLTTFGKFLRSTSLDELPEILFNILLRGNMSIVGPRPQLIRDMVYMTTEQRKRHIVTPGLTGLAQVNGRNAITWEEKLDWDIRYVESLSFVTDFKMIIGTVFAVLKRSGITDGENATALDYGDALLKSGIISKEEYMKKQEEAELFMDAFK